MKIQIRNYAFDPIAKTVTFKDYSGISLDSVLLVVNVTDNQVIYNFANPAAGGTVSGNVLTLMTDTSMMSATDKLLIYYDSDATPASDDAVILLRRLVQILAPIATQDANQRQRVVIDAIATVNVNNTPSVNINTTTAAFNGVDPRYMFIDAARNAYANGLRQNLIFS